jgi:hypothetical protein
MSGPQTVGSVFISYRRGGGAEIARVVEAFLDAQGFDVFLDVDSLGGGHFDEQILREIEAREVFILICSSGCFERCIDPSDWVRRELECALLLGKHLVPVTLRGFEWPGPLQLPDSIRNVARHNAFEYSGRVKRIASRAFMKGSGDRLGRMNVARPAVLEAKPPFPSECMKPSGRIRRSTELLGHRQRGGFD